MASADAVVGPPVGEFTRRKNWSQNILDQVRDWMHVLGSDYNIIYGSPASGECFGYDASELVGHLMTEFIHVDDRGSFARAFRAARDTLQPFRGRYRVQTKDDKYVVVETTGHFYKQSFFGSARVLPAGATEAMEAFLDLRMEHEALQQRLRYLKQQSAATDESPGSAGSPNVYAPGSISTSYEVSESVSLFTGLHYHVGERVRDISTVVDRSATVGPSASSVSAQRSCRNKKKRMDTRQQQHQSICVECGATDSPEWRKGPMGSKSLCNACGLRWAKAQKEPVAWRRQ